MPARAGHLVLLLTLPIAAAATGNAAAQAAPAILLSPASVNFGSISLGSSSAPLVVTASNTGSATLVIGQVGVSGDFNQSNDCGTLAAGASCTVNVTFTPTAAGLRSGALSFTDNVSGSPQIVALAGTGQGSGSNSVTLAAANGGSLVTSVSPGQTATYYLTLNGDNGFVGTVTLTCGGAPQGAACTANPATTVIGAAAVPVSVTVTTSSGAAMPAPPWRPRANPDGLLYGLAFGLLLAMVGIEIGRRRRAAAGVCALLAFCFAAAACGGNAPASSATPLAATPTGTYTLTLTAASGGAAVGQAQMTLVVQ